MKMQLLNENYMYLDLIKVYIHITALFLFCYSNRKSNQVTKYICIANGILNGSSDIYTQKQH